MDAFRALPGRLNISKFDLNLSPNHATVGLLKQSPLYEQFYEQVLPYKSTIDEFLATCTYTQVAIFVFCLYFALSPLFNYRPKVKGAVYQGYRSWWEPTFLLQTRFIGGAKHIIADGYRKYNKTGTPFVLRRYDVDISVLPTKYLNELRLLPLTKLSGVKAQVANLCPKYTYTGVMIESNLHFRVCRDKLTTELPKHIGLAEKEFEYGWEIDMPQPDDWTEIDIQHVIRMLVARMSARVFLGHPACRNPEWLKIAWMFSVDMFATVFALRAFPPWMHPVVAYLLPTRWRIRSHLKKAQRIIGPLMEAHRKALAAKARGEDVEEEETLLHWMMDNGNEKENRLPEMATRQCILTLASIHTTSMGVDNMLMDLCAHPEWFPVMRDEIDEVKQELGKLGTPDGAGAKQWVTRLEKMDSFFVESQRFNPPTLLVPQRLALVPITLKDGTQIPAGTRLACASDSMLNDSSVTESPTEFDPMRSYRKRQAAPDQKLKHMAGQAVIDNLSFGYGKLACPGRYFAVAEIKMVLARLLDEFEFKFPEGKSRPGNFHAHENLFIDPRARIMMRKRRPACAHCGRS